MCGKHEGGGGEGEGEWNLRGWMMTEGKKRNAVVILGVGCEHEGIDGLLRDDDGSHSVRGGGDVRFGGTDTPRRAHKHINTRAHAHTQIHRHTHTLKHL